MSFLGLDELLESSGICRQAWTECGAVYIRHKIGVWCISHYTIKRKVLGGPIPVLPHGNHTTRALDFTFHFQISTMQAQIVL